MKTLEDLPHSEIEFTKYLKEIMIPEKDLKNLASEWVKEDMEWLSEYNGPLNLFHIIERWKKRFNLTEEDLQ